MLISATDLVKSGYSLYRANFKEFLKYGLAQYAPGLAASILMNLFQFSLAFSKSLYAVYFYFLIALLIQIAGIIVSYWILGAFTRVIATRYNSQTPGSMSFEMAAAKPLLWPAVIAGVLVGLALILGMFLFIIPGIIFSIWFAFYTQAAFVDGKKGKLALTESKRLVEGRWWAVFGKLLLVSISVGAVAALILGIPLVASFLLRDNTIYQILTWLLSLVVVFLFTIISIPYAVVCQTILYFSLKKDRGEAVAPAPPTETATTV